MTAERDYGSRTLMEKLGVDPGARASVISLGDDEFVKQLRDRGANVSLRRRKDSDLVFMRVETIGQLGRLNGIEPYLRRDGAVWVTFPRGRQDLREVDVISAGLGAGLVDNKVVRFSDTHTALRFVIPVARR
jgi:hypothetical protein